MMTSIQYSIIGIVAILEVVLFVIGVIRKDGFRQRAPGLMTTLGILGTFVGITIAIYGLDFTSDEITDSVTGLLNGMKVAFVTSVLGLLFSFVFRLLFPFKQPRKFFLKSAKQLGTRSTKTTPSSLNSKSFALPFAATTA